MKQLLFSRTFLVCASIALCLLILEIGTSIWIHHLASRKNQFRYSLIETYPRNRMRLSPHHYLNYYPTPNYENGLTSHNSMGYRGPECSRTKPPGTFRIVALGGSTTYTEGVDDNAKTFPRQLETKLRETHSYKNVEVINAGVPGFNSWESLINLQFRVLDLAPDLVIIYHGTNDVHARLVKPGRYVSDNSGRRKQWKAPPVPFWEYSALGRVVSRATGLTPKGHGIGAFVNSQDFVGHGAGNNRADEDEDIELLRKHPPIFFERNLVDMVAVARAHGVQVILATFAQIPRRDHYSSTAAYRQGYQEGNDVLREVARRLEVPLFDFEKVMPPDEQYWKDGVHVNEQGAALKAELFSAFLHEQGLIRGPAN